ncbi:MAG: NUDIX domain-containing protein [Nitriliruptorales bacterium]|nr:NUDIX domain-containing protein [Nitriliruptorales bacterium]
MGWAQFRDGDTIFQVRVAGVAVADGRVLLHRLPTEDFWSLPGGRIEVGESAGDALHREMREEIDAEVEVGGLLWVIENFFEHAPLDDSGQRAPTAHHEIGLYLEMSVPDEVEQRDSLVGIEFAGTEREHRLEFRWFGQDEVGAMDVRPEMLRDRLASELPPARPLLVRGR